MIAIEKSPASFAQTAFEALEALASPKTAHRRRKADRQAALAKGRTAIRRLKATPMDVVAATPHLAAARVAIETLEAAVLSLDSIARILQDADELISAADQDGAPDGEDGTRAILAERYDELREDITRIAGTAYAGRTNLLDGLGGQLDVPLDARGRAQAIISGANATADPAGLDIPAPEGAFASAGERQTIKQSLTAALLETQTLAARFEMDAALLAARIHSAQAAITSLPPSP